MKQLPFALIFFFFFACGGNTSHNNKPVPKQPPPNIIYVNGPLPDSLREDVYDINSRGDTIFKIAHTSNVEINNYVDKLIRDIRIGEPNWVTIEVVIDELGIIHNPRIVRGGNREQNIIALNIVGTLPNFPPPYWKGRFVKAYVNIHFRFK